MCLKIRDAKICDAINLAALSIQVWLHTYAVEGIRTAFSEFVLNEFTKRKFEQYISDHNFRIIIAEIDSHLVGYASLKFNSHTPSVFHTNTELVTLYVQEHFTRKGIGSKLFLKCSQIAAEHCSNSDLWLSVYYKNDPAIAFYKSIGYTQHGSFDFEFSGEKHKNFIFAKPLPSALPHK